MPTRDPSDYEVIGWKLFYGDGTVFSSRDGTWEDALADDVQILLLYEKGKDGLGRNTRTMLCGDRCDFYFKDGDVYGCFMFGEDQRGLLKKGKWTDGENFAHIQQRALEDYSP